MGSTKGVVLGMLAVAVCSGTAVSERATQATGPIGYWRFEETASPVEDAVGTADGAWVGPVQAAADVPSQITFDDCGSLRFRPVATAGGVNYVSLGRTAALDAVQNGSFTLSAWFKPASLPPGTGSDTQYGIVLKGGYHEGLSMAGGGFVMGHWVSTSPNPTYVSAGYGNNLAATGTWYHVAGVVDVAALKVRIYVNGAPEPVNPTGDMPAAPAPTTGWAGYNNEPWQVGVHLGDVNSGVRYQADGWIDDVRIYDRALTPTEISTLANGGVVEDPPMPSPTAPAGLTATAGTNQVSLAWTAVPNATGYNVKRSTISGAETQLAVAPTNAYVDSGLTAGTEYFYVVSALIRCSEGPNSVEDSAIPTAVVPPAPRTKADEEDQPCGCGSAESSGAGLALGLALLVAYGIALRSQSRT
jgi:hypothetical protein